MRELKFKGWDKTQKKWLSMDDKITIAGETDDWYEWIISISPSGILELHQDMGVDIVQYTGSKDEQGKEIYEEDWLKWDKNFFRVMYDTFNGCWYGEPHLDNPMIGILGARAFTEAEVIGNSFENPGLKGANND